MTYCVEGSNPLDLLFVIRRITSGLRPCLRFDHEDAGRTDDEVIHIEPVARNVVDDLVPLRLQFIEFLGHRLLAGLTQLQATKCLNCL